ncbi:MAG: SIMPL domain-containing protein [ANME-2 cluster archaeon]|nr:SIMPL domain-containing protein [ANME-2 cluster archaeon]
MNIRNIYSSLMVLIALVVIAGTASAYFVQSSSAGTVTTASGNEVQVNTIIVGGTGTVSMSPDKAIVYLGVQTQAKDAQGAQQENAVKMEKIIKALKSAGISEDDMETSGYSIYPMRNYETPEPTITGYTVSNQLKVTVKDIDDVGDVIDVAVDAGANEVQGVSFTLSDKAQQDAREQALENAVKAARADADTLARALDVAIVAPLEITTSGGSIATPYPMSYAVAEEMGYAGSAVRTPTPIQPGDVSVTAYVQVIYQFT